MERLLLLWDELDELLGYGRHLAVGLTHAMTSRGRPASQTLVTGPASAETGMHRALNP
ncbi:MAG TPA: hypothetical protein VEQ17_10370 [Steroidobacteraceae bacterium]|jgi:hypothetical protein|nr:hypothetical protein [Steroidobacteraceae bacterium]